RRAASLTTVLAGGVGAARFLTGLVQVVEPGSVTAIVNVGDDTVLHGLHISPDLDTVTYTLAGAINPETGWGLRDESWQAMITVEGEGEVGFQDYFVGRQHSVAVTALRFDGAESSRPAPGVADAIGTAATVVIAPSNPLVSIAPVLAVPGVRDAVRTARART